MPVGDDRHDVALGTHPRVDHGDVHRAVGKVAVRPRQPEARLRRPVHRDIVGHVDDPRLGQTRQDATLHGRDERPLRTKVGGERDDAAG